MKNISGNIPFEHRLNFCVGSVRFCLLAPIEMFAKPFTCWWKPFVFWRNMWNLFFVGSTWFFAGDISISCAPWPKYGACSMSSRVYSKSLCWPLYIYTVYKCDRCECIIQFPTLAHASAGLPTHLNQEKYPYHVRWCWQLLAKGYPVNKLKTSTINQIGTKPDIKPINRGTLWWLNWTKHWNITCCVSIGKAPRKGQSIP